MNTLRNLTLIIMTTPLLASAVLTSCASNLPKATEKVTPYIVQIVVADNMTNGEALNVTPIGSGFFVNRAGWLVTTKQVIDLATAEVKKRGPGASTAVVVPGNPALGIGSSSNSNPLATPVNELEFVATQRLSEVAVVKLKTDLVPNPGNGAVRPVINYATHLSGTLNFGPVPLLQRQLKVRDPVAVAGYIKVGFTLTTSSGRIIPPELTTGYSTDLASNPALSGAPVYLSDGAIVGMFDSLPNQPASVISTRDIIEFLDNCGIEWRR